MLPPKIAEIDMRDFNWIFAGALLGPLATMLAVYCFGLYQEFRADHSEGEIQ